MQSSYTIDFYSAIKKDEVESFVEKWMPLEFTILGEENQICGSCYMRKPKYK